MGLWGITPLPLWAASCIVWLIYPDSDKLDLTLTLMPWFHIKFNRRQHANPSGSALLQLSPNVSSPPPGLWNIFLKFSLMFAALIQLDIIKESPVPFSSFWYTLEYEKHFDWLHIKYSEKSIILPSLPPRPQVNFCFQSLMNQSAFKPHLCIEGLQGTGHLNAPLTTFTHYAKDTGSRSLPRWLYTVYFGVGWLEAEVRLCRLFT